MDFREKTSELIHEEWMLWAITILKNEPGISVERRNRWIKECIKPYKELSEDMKNLDRVFADKFISLIGSASSDRYLSLSECVKRLVNDYKTHNNLFVAFDFDNTVFDYHKVGDTFPKIEEILIKLHKLGITLILFTGNEGDKLDTIVKYCEDRGYPPKYINENPIMKTRKPYYNILLDDRAGLNDAYQTLQLTLNILNLNK